MSHKLQSSFELPSPRDVVDRRSFLPDRAAGLRVLHLGCVDEHLTETRAGTGGLLHEQLANRASHLIGLDISESGLEKLSQLVPGTYVHGDVQELGTLELPDTDLVIAAEIIEHLGSPGPFLQGLRSYLDRSGARAIITTPNAYSWRHWVSYAAKQVEMTHPDHRLLFSATTLRQLIEAEGLEVRDLWIHTWSNSSSLKGRGIGWIDRLILSIRPMLGVGLIFEVVPRRSR